MNKPLNQLAPFLTNLNFIGQRVPGVFEKGLALTVLNLHNYSGDVLGNSRDGLTKVIRPLHQTMTNQQEANKGQLSMAGNGTPK